MVRFSACNSSLAAMVLGLGLPAASLADGFPAINRIASGFGYYNIDKGFDDKLKVYGTVDGFVNYQESGHYSGFRVAGGAAWTNKLGLYMRKALNPDTVLEMDVEEGFNLNGQALDQHWKQVGALRLAVAALRCVRGNTASWSSARPTAWARRPSPIRSWPPTVRPTPT
jgi:hypothetical protein